MIVLGDDQITNMKINLKICDYYFPWKNNCPDKDCKSDCRDLFGKTAVGQCQDPKTCHCTYIC